MKPHFLSYCSVLKHNPALDGLRGLAILLVLLMHSFLNTDTGPIGRLLLFVTRSGWIGVDLFFVLSGFLITRILLDSYGTTGYLRNFYGRRVLRIMPLYFAVLALCFVAPRIGPDDLRSLFDLGAAAGFKAWYPLFLGNVARLFMDSDPPNTVAVMWSVAVEEQFYLFWPVVVAACARKRVLLHVSIALAVLSLILRLIFRLAGYSWEPAYFLMPARLDPLAIGAVIAVLSRREAGLKSLLPWAWGVFIVSFSGLFALALQYGYLPHFEAPVQVVGYTALALGFGALLTIVLASPSTAFIVRLFSVSPARALGKYSYGIYLEHSIILVLGGWFVQRVGLVQIMGFGLTLESLFTATAIIVCFAVAWLTWHVYESRFLNLKRHFAYAIDASPQRVNSQVPELNPSPALQS
jgi:peptidoglycan/LPS O-acetylase OafA/YrhL